MRQAQQRVGRGGFRLLGALAAALLAAVALGQPLNDSVNRLVGNAKLTKSRVGVSIVDADSGLVLADINGGTALIPASNAKLLTSAGALWTLGPDHTFRTEVLMIGDRLLVRGNGDPALGDPDLRRGDSRIDPETILGMLAASVREAGVGNVREIVIDDRVFDREYYHPSWPAGQLNTWYCAQVGGVNFHCNVVWVYCRPSADGEGRAPSVRLEPASPWFEIDNKARTAAEGKGLIVSRPTVANRVVVSGEIRVPTGPDKIAVHEPPLFFGRLFADRLGRNLSGGVPPARVASAGETFPTGRVLATVSTPMADILRRCNADSYNLYAEALFKAIGNAVTNEPGSWANGAAVLRMLISQKLGPEHAAATTLADGSGMSRLNQVSPNTLTRLLVAVHRDKTIAPRFVTSLAAPGSGTLRNRFREVKLTNELHAKSGYLSGVRALSGYVTDPSSGRRIAFSVLVNGADADEDRRAVKMHEEIVATIDRYLARINNGEARVRSGE